MPLCLLPLTLNNIPSPTLTLTPSSLLSYLMAPTSALASSRTVCVMDSSGPLGATLVKKLLNMGYIVHAATSNPDEYNRLQGLSRENKMLKAFQSEFFDYHSIVEALKGCSGIFYGFETAQNEHSSYDEFMAEIEMRAALNVIEACAQTDTMERVVFTSSVTAIIWKENRKLAADLDEKDWSDPNFCRKFKLWYALAKTMAEKTAWSLAMDRGVHMVSINAGLLTGPELSAMSPCLKGASEMYKDGVLALVNVDFLVDAQICAFKSPSANGRYLCFNHVVNCPKDAVKLAQMLVPSSPGAPPSDDTSVIQQRIHSKKLKMVMTGFHNTGGVVARGYMSHHWGLLAKEYISRSSTQKNSSCPAAFIDLLMYKCVEFTIIMI